MTELVRLEHVHKAYPMGRSTVHALSDVSFVIGRGEYVAIMGSSGSGKSTLLNLLGCLDRPTSGRYFLGERDVSVLTDPELSEIRGRQIGFVFQSFNLIPQLTVQANIEVPLFYQGVPRRRRHPVARDLAGLVGLAGRADHRPTELSGGECQRVAIARALANDPLLLLADEPTGNLDSATTEEILLLLDDMSARGRTIIMVTHETHVAARARRIIHLKDGAVDSDETTAPAEART